MRSDKGQSRYFSKCPEAGKFVLAKYKEGPLSYALIYEALIREWPSLYGESRPAPSMNTVRNYIESLPPVIRDAARMPRQQHESKYAPYLSTDIEKVAPNQIWVCDHRIYDVIGYNDCFDGAEEFAAMRIWETCIEDMRTRVIVGSWWDVTPSSATISQALREGISRFGLPQVFYCDNGKDFRKIGGAYSKTPIELDDDGRVRIDGSADALLIRLGIQPKYCIPRHPQSKQVESYFSTVSKRFDVLFGASYAGRKPSLRPDECREAEKQHREWLADKRKDTPLERLSSLITLHRQWTEEFNHDHKHSGRGMNGRTPYAVMDELLPPSQRQIPDMEELAPLFWRQKELTVGNTQVKFEGLQYEGETPQDAGQMYCYNGRPVLVRRDPQNVGVAAAFNSDGEFIARLKCKELALRVPDLSESPVTERAIKYVSRLRNKPWAAASKNGPFWKTISAGVPTEKELLAERAAKQTREPLIVGRKKGTETGAADRETPYIEDVVARARAASCGNPYIEDVGARLRAARKEREAREAANG